LANATGDKVHLGGAAPRPEDLEWGFTLPPSVE
jgi:hypothetical protein